MDSSASSAVQGESPKKSIFDDLTREELVTKCKGLLALAQKAKHAKAELQNEVESYKLQLDKCETEKKASQENVHTLQELVDSLTEQKLNYITELDLAQSKIKTLNRNCSGYDEEVKKYNADLLAKDKYISEITQKLSDIDSEVISLKRQNNRLLEENEQLINQLTELETRTAEFNNIGLQQREQLRLLEEKVQTDDTYKFKAEELNEKIKELESKLQTTEVSSQKDQQISDYETKIREVTQLYESEKSKKEKANIKLRSYKDKILKCAACITQLKNSRFILTKTVKDYSENIPKWQNDIIKASKMMEQQVNEINNENIHLKEIVEKMTKKLAQISQNNTDFEKYNSQLNDLTNENNSLKIELTNLQSRLHDQSSKNDTLNNQLLTLKSEYENVYSSQLPQQINKNRLLEEELAKLTQKINSMSLENNNLNILILDLKLQNKNNSLKYKNQSNDLIEKLTLHIKALESEKATLVKEKLNARDSVVELETSNKTLTDQLYLMTSEIQTLKSELEAVSQEKLVMQENYRKEKYGDMNSLKCNLMTLQEQYDLLKKEYDNMNDLNGLLKEEVETLKSLLEQPKDSEHLSDVNESLQTDIVKLETKLAAYKHENASLLNEVKESRAKVKEFDVLAAECDEAKSKLAGYKTENTELLIEMKEINQVLKERGEAISKLQKAIAEMERLIETLEKDRDIVKQEKNDLSKKVGRLENELKDSDQKTNKITEATEQIAIERDNAIKSLADRDLVITSLKDEIEKFKQHQTSSDLPNEDMSTSTISKAEEHYRMKDLDETFEEKYTKLRIFALKLKKKLNETISQLQNAEQDKAKLEKLLSEHDITENRPPLTTRTNQIEELKDEDDKNKISDLQMRVKSLTEAAENSEKLTAELENIKAEFFSKTQELTAEIEAHKVTKDSLEKARRDVKKKNVLSLEMEDYERSMKELTSKMEDNKKKMVQMESTIDTQEGTITAMKTQIKLLEEQIKTEEIQNRVVKEELQHSIEEVKEKDNIIQLKNAVITKLEQDLEDEKRKNEEADLELTSLLSEKEKVIISLGEDKADLNNRFKRMEFRCAELNETLRITNIELADLKTEYISYKVRAQAVLRQNQTVDHSQEEQLKEEAAALKAQIETLTTMLASVQELYTEQGAEVESYRRRASEAAGEAARAQQRHARLQADLTRLGQQLESDRAHHKLQVSTLTQCYKTQINDLEAKLQKETDALRKQLPIAHENIKSVNVGSMGEANHNQYMLPVIPKEDGSDGEMDINVSMLPREEGEGSEFAPSPPLSKSFMTGGGSGHSPVSLERLLEEGVPEDETLDTASMGLTSDQEIADLRRKLLAQHQRVKHITVLLSQSERECARMAQLSELLKAELRRARGTAHVTHNTEYMKNVTLKFLMLPPGDERSRLVPVLQKILTLTSEETHKIQAVAKGLDPNPSKGWGNYLPWPGGK